MRVVVYRDNGEMVMIYEAGEYKGVKQACYPAKQDVPAVGSALAEAVMFLDPRDYRDYFSDHDIMDPNAFGKGLRR